MSFDYNIWESKLRSEVENHEFAFDDSAWEEMDKLLNQGGGISAPHEGLPNTSAGKFTPWIISSLIVTTIGLLSWWLFQTNTENNISLNSFHITVTPEKEPSVNHTLLKSAPTFAEAGDTHPSNPKQVFPANASKKNIRVEKVQSSLVSKVIPEGIAPEEKKLADRSGAYLTLPLPNSTIISPLPTTLDEPALEKFSVILKRKRNRRTLYPDVIEKY